MSDYGWLPGAGMKGFSVLGAVISVAGIAVGYLAGRLISPRQDNEQSQKTEEVAANTLDKDSSAVASLNLANTSPAVASQNSTNNSPKLKAYAITAGCTILG